MNARWVDPQVEKQEHGHMYDGLKMGLTCGLLCCGVLQVFSWEWGWGWGEGIGKTSFF